MSVDLPEPETPVMQTRPPTGIDTSMPLRLFSRAFLMVMAREVLSWRRFTGMLIWRVHVAFDNFVISADNAWSCPFDKEIAWGKFGLPLPVSAIAQVL